MMLSARTTFLQGGIAWKEEVDGGFFPHGQSGEDHKRARGRGCGHHLTRASLVLFHAFVGTCRLNLANIVWE